MLPRFWPDRSHCLLLPTLNTHAERPVLDLPTLNTHAETSVLDLPTLNTHAETSVLDLPTLNTHAERPVLDLPTLNTRQATGYHIDKLKMRVNHTQSQFNKGFSFSPDAGNGRQKSPRPHALRAGIRHSRVWPGRPDRGRPGCLREKMGSGPGL